MRDIEANADISFFFIFIFFILFSPARFRLLPNLFIYILSYFFSIVHFS